jgi:vacuolar-type H+-ATPase subunit F/Vma7
MTRPGGATSALTVRAVTGPALAAGFRLAGLRVDEVDSTRDALTRIDQMAGDGETGVILVQQDLYDAMPDVQRRALEREPVPIIVPIPGATWAAGARDASDFLLDLLQRAIGYRVRLQ